MMATTVTELDRKIETARDGTKVTRTLLVTPYSDYKVVVARLLGTVSYINNTFFRTMPMADPGEPHCYAKSVEIEGEVFVDTNNPTTNYTLENMLNTENKYRDAKLTVTYESNTFTPSQWASNDETILCGMTWDFSAQQLTLPNDWYAWKNSNTIPIGQSNVNATKTLPKGGVQLVRYYCVNRPINAILQLQGKVNASDFAIQDILFPAETMLLETGPQIVEKVTYNQIKYYEINYKFSIQGTYDYYATSSETVNSSGVVTSAASTSLGYVGHNRLYRPDRGYWDYIESVNGSKKIYMLDSTITQTLPNGATVTGFDLLFDPQAR